MLICSEEKLNTISNYSRNFHNASPFPILVIDNFLENKSAEILFKKINKLKLKKKSNDLIFANGKYECSDLSTLGKIGDSISSLFLSKKFADSISKLTGRNLIVDPKFVGGGIHKAQSNSFLSPHVDFQIHPGNKFWRRRLNILLYLNKNWKSEYKGCLELENAENKETLLIEPLFNRLVIMESSLRTIHGYSMTSFPKDLARISIAAYAYSIEESDINLRNFSTTTLWEINSKNPLRKFLGSFISRIVKIKQKYFGSRTLNNSRKK